MSKRAGTTAVMTVVAALILSGCGVAAEPETTRETVHVVVIGVPPNLSADGCEGCTGWVEQFTDHVASELGAETTYEIVDALGVPEATAAVSEPGPDADSVAAADIVIVYVGGNNALPDPETGIGCTTWFLEAQGPCLDEGVATYGALYDELFSEVKALHGDEPVIYIATTVMNGNISPADVVPDGLLSHYVSTHQEEEAKAWAVAAYDRWNAMLTERATAAGFEVVDLYHAVHGADGTRDWIPDYHTISSLNQAGHDLIASQLARVDLSAITGK